MKTILLVRKCRGIVLVTFPFSFPCFRHFCTLSHLLYLRPCACMHACTSPAHFIGALRYRLHSDPAAKHHYPGVDRVCTPTSISQPLGSVSDQGRGTWETATNATFFFCFFQTRKATTLFDPALSQPTCREKERVCVKAGSREEVCDTSFLRYTSLPCEMTGCVGERWCVYVQREVVIVIPQAH